MLQLLRNNKGFLLFLFLFGILRTAVADWSPIPSASMRPNLLEGDVVLINRVAYDLAVPLTGQRLAHLGDPARGEIVVFRSPKDGVRLIKRVIAVPGDVVAMHDDRLTINGEAARYALATQSFAPGAHGLQLALGVQEQVAGTSQRIQLLPARQGLRDMAPLTIPPGHYLMLGDNRNDSADSRVFGLVERKHLIGRAERILVSLQYLDDWQMRWSRFGMALGASGGQGTSRNEMLK